MYDETMMTKPFEAVYEGGVLRPLQSLALDEHQRVTVMLQPAPASSGEESWLDIECMQLCAHDADEGITLEAVRQALSKISGPLTADFIEERAHR